MLVIRSGPIEFVDAVLDGNLATTNRRGFTLIELSIVLVIIGLIAGAILVGRDMIAAAAVRSQITQIEQYNVAVNVFRDKYRYLPGDIPATPAARFGFVPRGNSIGKGDGNGFIIGYWTGSGATLTSYTGETATFWEDLSGALLIGNTFTFASATATYNGGDLTQATSPTIDAILPSAKIGTGNYVYVYNGATTGYGVGANYFGISAVTRIGNAMTSTPGLTVQQAYNIDMKIDDGLPQKGKVLAAYADMSTYVYAAIWAGSGGQIGAAYTTATAASPTTCFDNGGVVGPMTYSAAQNNGEGLNCGLSIRF